jgi:DUF2905 family protein
MRDRGPMVELGKALLGLGILMAVVGGVLLLAGRTGLPLGRLPGDFSFRGKNFGVYFPLGTSILISVILTVLFYLFSKIRK